MQVHIHTDHIGINSHQSDYIEEKLLALKKYSERLSSNEDALQLWVNLERNATLKQKEQIIMRVTLSAPKAMFRAEVDASTVEEATDLVHDKLLRQIERYKAKHMHDRDVTADELSEMMMGQDEETGLEGKDLRITKRKLFSDLVPMTETEAINQMKLLGHTFFIFVNALTDRYNVLYMRPDKKSFGLVELEHADGVIGN